MTVNLDYQQRLNLAALIGQQKGTVADLRLWWSLLDKLELSAEEKKFINFRLVQDSGYSIPTWDAHAPVLSEIELSADELGKVREVLDNCPNFRVVDYVWLRPLLSQLENMNGDKL